MKLVSKKLVAIRQQTQKRDSRTQKSKKSNLSRSLEQSSMDFEEKIKISLN